jgi:histidinol-phosphate phosphatase family protein
VLVDGASVRRGTRMRSAALGLAMRGHRISWVPSPGDADALSTHGVEPAAGGLALGRDRVDLALGAGRPARAARLAWLAGAHALVGEVAHRDLASWGAFDRLGWQSLHSFALVEEQEADAVSASPGPLVLERVGLWSSAAPPASPLAEHLDVEILERACERSLARHRGIAPRPAIFLDRDGTLVEEVGYLSDPAAMRLLPGVAPALRSMRGSGHALVVISNQAGVGRGLFPLSRAHATMARLRELLRLEGVELDGVYFCPHHPDAGCACRKPGTELLERADEDLLLDPRRSAMIGDKRIDVEAGRRAGTRGILVRTGYGEEEARASGADEKLRPD